MSSLIKRVVNTPESRISLAPNTFVARSLPGVGSSPAGDWKHSRAAYNGSDQNIYIIGGDYSGSSFLASFRQELWTYYVETDTWTLIQPYCRTDDALQPDNPDEHGWVYDSNRHALWLLYGFKGATSENCPTATYFATDKIGKYVISSDAWSAFDNSAISSGLTSRQFAQYDPANDEIIRFIWTGIGAGYEIYDPATDSWSSGYFTGAANNANRIDKSYTAMDLTNRYIYSYAPFAGKLVRYDMDAKDAVYLSDLPSGAQNNAGGVYPVWDSVNSKLLLFSRGSSDYTRLDVYDPGLDQWTQHLIDQPDGYNVQGNIFCYHPAQNCVMVAGGYDPDVPYIYLYRYGAQTNPYSEGVWYAISSNTMDDVADPNTDDTKFHNLMDAWSGAVFDTLHNRLIVHGGGHVDAWDNAIYAFYVDQGKWRRIKDLDAVVAEHTDSDVNDTYYSDGTPASVHTYNQIIYLPTQNAMLRAGGSAWKHGDVFDSGTVVRFDFLPGIWNTESGGAGALGTVPGSAGTWTSNCFLAYDADNDIVLAVTIAGIYTYDPATDTWSGLLRSDATSGRHIGAFELSTRRLVTFTDAQGYRIWDVSNPASIPSPTSISPTGWTHGTSASFVYDPVGERILGWNGGTSIYALDISNETWALLTVNGGVTPTSANANGTYGRLAYSPLIDCVIVVNATDESVYAYRPVRS